MDMTPTHRVLDLLQHVGVYVGGLFTVLSAVFTYWLRGKRKLKKQVNDNSVLVKHLVDNGATIDDLRKCRENVDKQDASNLQLVLSEIKSVRTEIQMDTNKNNTAHNKIIDRMNEQHSDTLKQMIKLHTK